MNPLVKFILGKMVGKAQLLLTNLTGKLLRQGLTGLNGYLLTVRLPGMPEGLQGELIQWAGQIVAQGVILAWSAAESHLNRQKGAAAVLSTEAVAQASTACPKTQQVAQTPLLVLVFLSLAAVASAQAPALSASAQVPSLSATNSGQAAAILNATPIGGALVTGLANRDTNSVFFSEERFAFRAGAVMRGKTPGATTGVDATFAKDWIACLDVIEGPTQNTVDAVQLMGGYRLPFGSLEVDALGGAGYRWDDPLMRIEGIVALRVSYSFNEYLFAFTQGGFEFNNDRPAPQVIVGVGVRLP